MKTRESSKDFFPSFEYFKRVDCPVVALATALGGPVAIIRVSGKELEHFSSLLADKFPEHRSVIYTRVCSMDNALVSFFKSPESFTGEDVLEVHCHGVASIVDEIIEAFVSKGALKALPGEFSFRAYLNDKMSLQQAELLNRSLGEDNIAPLSASSMISYTKKNQEQLELVFSDLKKSLDSARGRLESAIDFPEAAEEQASDVVSARESLLSLKKSVNHLLSSFENFSYNSGELTMALVGSTNVGKSTLFNLLSGGERALVSSVAGTTRDYVESRIKLGSQWIRLIDTAGIRESSFSSDHELLEKRGIELSLDILNKAQILICVSKSGQDLDSTIESTLQSLDKKVLRIYSHADQNQDQAGTSAFNFLSDEQALRSFLSDNLESLLSVQKNESTPEVESLLSKRQARLLSDMDALLSEAIESLNNDRPLELVADDLRKMEELLQRCVGKDLSQDYIGQIFSQFCLGK